jgi:hypothetical protein
MWVPGPLIPMALGELLRGSSAACQLGQVFLRLPYQERRQRPDDLGGRFGRGGSPLLAEWGGRYPAVHLLRALNHRSPSLQGRRRPGAGSGLGA